MMKIRKNTIIKGVLGSIAIGALFYLGNVKNITGTASSSLTKADTTGTSYALLKQPPFINTKKGAFGESVNSIEKVTEEDVAEYIRRPKYLPKDFTGYKIELFTVFNKELSLNDKLYQQFGGINIEERTTDSYTYLMGEFTDKRACEDYLKVITNRYEEAKGVKYNNGNLVNYK